MLNMVRSLFVFGKLKPETLLNSPHFIKANKKARKFIGNQIDESNILADPTYKDVMFSELVNIVPKHLCVP